MNGVAAVNRSGFVTGYETIEIAGDSFVFNEARPRIVLAAHCHQTSMGQGVDVGLSLLGVKPDRLEEGVLALRCAATVSEKMAPTDPKRRLIRQDLAAAFFDMAELMRGENRSQEVARMLEQAMDLVTSDSATNAQNRRLTG